MVHVLLLGAGNIGVAIAKLLAGTDDYALTVADTDEERLSAMPKDVPRKRVDVSDRAALGAALAGMDYVLSACPFYLNVAIAEVARQHGVHYFDLTEDVATAHRVRELAKDASTVFVPQCGLAPGFISIAASQLAKRFDKLNRVRMRVGALPIFPSNALKYNLTWSTAGLINEYCNPCHVIHDGAVREVLPLEGLEEFSLDGVSYEAFNTSGGLGTLWESLAGKVDYLNYKTIRYPGHCELVRFLCNDLRLGERRKLFQDVLEHAVPVTTQDVVLIFVTVSGTQNGRLVQETYTKKVYHGDVAGTELSAIQLTTAAALCAMVDLHREGQLPRTGFIKQEDVSLSTFLQNRFGQHYG
jgi:saccharopine dehydrogenase-like NADP-dependent oxidoreductase